MNEDKAQKRVSLIAAVLACLGTFLASIGGTVAWATQFQTKKAAADTAAMHEARMKTTEEKQADAAATMSAVRQDVADVKETVNRVDDKIDRLLLLRGRR